MPVASSFWPLEEKQASISFRLYKSTAAAPYFITEPGCVEIGSLTASACRDRVPRREDRNMVCAFKFGLTEIEVTVTNPLGEKTTHVVSFNM